MRMVFFVITALGLVYLIVSSVDADLFTMDPQSSAANAQWPSDRLSETNALTNANKDIETTAQSAGSNDDVSLAAKINQRIAKLEQENSDLQHQLSTLNSAYAQLENEFATLDAKAAKAADGIAARVASREDHAEQQNKVEEASRDKLVEMNPQITNNMQNKYVDKRSTALQQQAPFANNADELAQQKRLQQQAVLRDLAQKRQLAAIQALQGTSGR